MKQKTKTPAKLGRKPVDTQALMVRLPSEDHARLDEICAKVEGTPSKPELVRRIIKDYFRRLEAYEAKKEKTAQKAA